MQYYNADIRNSAGTIETVCYKADGMRDARAKAWEFGELMSDPEPMEGFNDHG